MESMIARKVGILCYPEIREMRCDICKGVLSRGKYGVWFELGPCNYVVVNSPTSVCCGREREFRQLFLEMEDAQKVAREIREILQGGGDPFKWRAIEVPQLAVVRFHRRSSSRRQH